MTDIVQQSADTDSALYHKGKLIYDLKLRGKSNKEILEIFGMDDTQVRRLREAASHYATIEGKDWPIDINQYSRWIHNRPHPQTQAQKIAEKDREVFGDDIKNLISSKEELRVVIPNDIHFPEEDPRALNIVLDFMDDYKPHVVIMGSDALEGYNLGRFGNSPDEQVQDYWESGLERLSKYSDIIRSIVPDAILVWIEGNHDARYLQWSRNNAAEAALALQKSYLDAVRRNGCYWLGETYDIVTIDQLCVSHGVYHGKNAVRQMYADYGHNYLVSVQGHIHRTSELTDTVTVFDGAVEKKVIKRAFTTGSLCQLTPLYEKTKSRPYRWNLGFGYATLRPTDNHFIDFKNPVIDHTTYRVRLEGKDYRG